MERGFTEFIGWAKLCTQLNLLRWSVSIIKQQPTCYLREQIDLFTFLLLPVLSLTPYYFGRTCSSFGCSRPASLSHRPVVLAVKLHGYTGH